MKFTLVYRGPVKPNGDRKHKHKLRRAFHPQLKDLWRLPPLNALATDPHHYLSLDPQHAAQSVICQWGGFAFAPVVSNRLKLRAHLEILFLRPEEAGKIIHEGGDIDNRIKTLLDALRVPTEGELPEEDTPANDESPFFCLLEDDALITGLSVVTDRLLGGTQAGEALLVITVQARPHEVICDTLDLLA